MSVLTDPVPTATARLLRRAVLDLATTEHRRRFPAVVHLGRPGSIRTCLTHDPQWDRGLRADLVGTALRAGRLDEAWVWLTRPGALTLGDVDAAWLTAVVATSAELDVDATFVVVTRHGWFDPRGGAGRTWRRIRQR